MKLDKKLVLIPQWIKSTLAAYDKPLNTVLSKNELLDIFSVEDVCFYKYASDLFESLDLFKLNSTFDIVHAFDNDELTDEEREKYKYVNDISSKFQQVQLGAKQLGEKLERSNKNGTGWTPKVYGAIVYTPADERLLQVHKSYIYVLEIYPINDTHLGITFGEDTSASDKNRIVQCLKILGDYYSFEQISHTELFKYYVGQHANI